MSGIYAAWHALTEPQAIILSALLTIVAAVAGVSLGSVLFGNRVKNLQDALAASEALVKDHKSTVEAILTELRDKIRGLDAQFASTTESLGQLRGTVDYVANVSAGKSGNDEQAATRDQLRSDWESIRDKLERVAANPAIDGRTRARYGRIDRRSYTELVNALASDQALGNDAGDFREAVALWHQYRNGRRQPTAEAVARMSELRNILAPQVS